MHSSPDLKILIMNFIVTGEQILLALMLQNNFYQKVIA